MNALFKPPSAGELLYLAGEIRLPYPRAKRAVKSIERIMAHAKAGTAQGTRGFLLVGDSQAGKTTILRGVRDKLNTPDALAEGRVPVLMVTLTPNATRKALLQDILQELEKHGVTTGWERGVETVLMSKVARFLPAMGVELLICDEFQHLVNSDSKNVASGVADQVKSFLIKGIVPVVMSGTNDAWKPIRANPELALRCDAPLELKAYDPLSLDDQEEFSDFLVAYLWELEQRNIIAGATDLLQDETIPEAIQEVACGILGRACNLLKDAIGHASEDGRNYITRADLMLAVDLSWLPQRLCKTNPFKVGLATISPSRKVS